MNRIISDTAEYGCYLFNHKCLPLLDDFMKDIERDLLVNQLGDDYSFDFQELKKYDEYITKHPIEKIGKLLRKNMSNMKN